MELVNVEMNLTFMILCMCVIIGFVVTTIVAFETLFGKPCELSYFQSNSFLKQEEKGQNLCNRDRQIEVNSYYSESLFVQFN